MPSAHTSLFDLVLILEILRYPRVISALFQYENGRTKYLHTAFDCLGLDQGPARGRGSHATGDIAVALSGDNL